MTTRREAWRAYLAARDTGWAAEPLNKPWWPVRAWLGLAHRVRRRP